MGVRFRFYPGAQLLPGETVLLIKPRIWAGSAKSLPTYRWFFSLPPLLDIGLVITNRRLLLVAAVLRLVTQEFSAWFDPRETTTDDERVISASVGRNSLWGPYIEIFSEVAQPSWYRSRELRLRLFTGQADSICRCVKENNTGGAGNRVDPAPRETDD